MLHTGLIAPVSELLERHRMQRPDKVAYWDAARSVTYSQLADRTASIAAGLSAQGVREGDRIALYLPNGVDWIEACFAGLRCWRGDRPHQLRCGRSSRSRIGCPMPIAAP